MVLNNEDNNTVTCLASDFTISNIEELKSGKTPRITGYISTSNIDSNNDMVTKEAQESLVKQINERIKEGKHITMDLDHESFERSKENPLKTTGKILNKIPVARIDSAEVVEDDGVYKTKVVAEVNEDHPLYSSILGSMKKKFLHSFSIVYKVTKGFVSDIEDKTVRVIEDLVLRNVGITGVPVNDDAEFQLSLKSYLKKMEENKLNELNTSFEELKSKVDSVETANEELKSQLSAKDNTIEELKSKLEASEKLMDDKIAALELAELKSKVESTEELKSKIEGFEKTLEELKSKGIHKAAPVAEPANRADVNLLGVL